MRLLRTSAVILIAISPSFLSAQLLRGRVLNAVSRAPVSGVQVTVKGINTATALTDTTGWFRVGLAGAGDYSLQTSVLGYQSIEQKLAVNAGEELIVDVVISPTAIPINPITIVARGNANGLAGFYARAEAVKRLGGGAVLMKSDIEKRNATRASHLFSVVAGVRISADTIRFGRSGLPCRPQVYVDGLPYSNGVVDLPPEVIAGIEVYRSGSQMPALYGDRTGCGVVLIWTERPTSQGRPVNWKRLLLAAGTLAGVIIVIRHW
jgi:hypothetical protein